VQSPPPTPGPWGGNFVGPLLLLPLLLLLLPLYAVAEPDQSIRLRLQQIRLKGQPKLVTGLVFLPQPGELLLSTMRGEIVHYRIKRGIDTERLGSFRLPEQDYGSQCAVSLALDPDFETNSLLYASYCISLQTGRISRMRFSTNYGQVAKSARTVYEVGHPKAQLPFHNIGSIGFDPEGALWALVGEKQLYLPAQDLKTDLGSLIRIRPRREDPKGGYDPDPRNPFADREGASPNILAYGLRSPWMGVLDRRGFYWIGDVGEHKFEEVNLLREPGQNFGWPKAEGPCKKKCEGLTDPLIALPHALTGRYGRENPKRTAKPRSVYVGLEYPRMDEDPYGGRLADAILIGDFYAGWVRAIRIDDDGRIVSDHHLAHVAGPSAWAVGPDSYIYVVKLRQTESSRLFRMLPVPAEPLAR